MRTFLLIFCSLILFQYCSTGRKEKQEKPVSMEVLNLFPGKWVKSSDSVQLIQDWRFDKKDVLTGYSYRLAGNDTSNQMGFTIDLKLQPLILVVHKPKQVNDIQYVLKNATNKQLMFENPNILFPSLLMFDFSSKGILNWTRKGGSNDDERILTLIYHKVDY
jgi:hypothetical protein